MIVDFSGWVALLRGIDLALTHREALTIGIAETIHAVHTLHSFDVIREGPLLR